MTSLVDLFDLDRTQLSTDWESLDDLFEDMLLNPEAQFICADDPGFNHSPPRIPRLGWIACSTMSDGSENIHEWTISLSNVKKFKTIKNVATSKDRADHLNELVKGSREL